MTESTTTARAPRRARTAAVGAVLGLSLAVAAPLAASAHVHVSPETGTVGESTPLTFSFSHGCDGSPTTALVFEIPEHVDGVTPVVDGAWDVERTLGDDGIATEVVYTARTPIEDGLSSSVTLNVIFASDADGTSVAFPVVQTCENGENAWTELAEEGEDPHDLDTPAPVVAVGAAATDTAGDASQDHDHADTDVAADDASADTGDEATADAAESQPATDTSSTVAVWLGAGALVVAVAALVAALRRRKA